MRARIAEPPPLAFFTRRSFHPWLVVSITCISAFIGQLDGSIVQLALPALKATFGTSIDGVRWIAVAYLFDCHRYSGDQRARGKQARRN